MQTKDELIKEKRIFILLWALVGIFGIHRIYLKNYIWAMCYLIGSIFSLKLAYNAITVLFGSFTTSINVQNMESFSLHIQDNLDSVHLLLGSAFVMVLISFAWVIDFILYIKDHTKRLNELNKTEQNNEKADDDYNEEDEIISLDK